MKWWLHLGRGVLAVVRHEAARLRQVREAPVVVARADVHEGLVGLRGHLEGREERGDIGIGEAGGHVRRAMRSTTKQTTHTHTCIHTQQRASTWMCSGVRL